MEDVTEYILGLPIITEAMSKLPKESFVLYECVYFDNVYKKETPRFTAQVIRKKDAAECLARYNELSKTGTFSMIPFDSLFLEGEFIGERDYAVRNAKLAALGIKTPELFADWKAQIEYAKTNKWEGLILRKPGESSYVGFTLDGKAKRMGAYKFKFIKEGDFFITEAEKGKSGKHASFYARFHVNQYDENNKLIDRGWVGGGNLSHEDLETITEELDSGKLVFPFVVEVEYQSIHEATGALQFGQILRVRSDKTATECLSEEE
jgi:ATP-dependent DNA ligase